MFAAVFTKHEIDHAKAMAFLREEQLFQAVMRNDHIGVRYWLGQGADVNRAASAGRTPLGAAAYIGNSEILKLLLDSNKDEKFPISHAKHFRHKKRIKRGIHTLLPPTEYKINLKSSIPYVTLQNCSFNTKHTCLLHGKDFMPSDGKDELNCEVYALSQSSVANRGYFVVVHDEPQAATSKPKENIPIVVCTCSPPASSSSSSSPSSSEANYDLEWDEEVTEDQPLLLTYEDEHWASLYKWYASILEKTGTMLTNTANDITGPDQQDIFQRTAVHYAAEQGHLDALKVLIEAGCNPDICSTDGLTPLHVAVTRNYVSIVEVLVKAGAYVNRVTVDKNTVLHIAASRGYCEMVDLLCKSNVALEARDLVERSALMVAASRARNRTVSILIAAGANVNAEEIHGYTPLCEAVWQCNVRLVAMLLKAGARVTHSHRLIHFATSHKQFEIVRLVSAAGGVNLYNDNGDTPLLVATKVLHPQIANILMKQGAKVNKCNSITGISVIHEIVESTKNVDELEEYLKVLLEYNVDLNIVSLAGDTALNRSILIERDDVSTMLIKHGADVNICDLESCALDNLTVVSRRHNLPLTRLILWAGHPAPPMSEVLEVRNMNSLINMYNLAVKPLTLMELSRVAIRKGTRCPIYKNVKALPLPKIMQKYLMFDQ